MPIRTDHSTETSDYITQPPQKTFRSTNDTMPSLTTRCRHSSWVATNHQMISASCAMKKTGHASNGLSAQTDIARVYAARLEDARWEEENAPWFLWHWVRYHGYRWWG